MRKRLRRDCYLILNRWRRDQYFILNKLAKGASRGTGQVHSILNESLEMQSTFDNQQCCRRKRWSDPLGTQGIDSTERREVRLILKDVWRRNCYSRNRRSGRYSIDSKNKLAFLFTTRTVTTENSQEEDLRRH